MMEASEWRRFENLIRARPGLNMGTQEAPLLGNTLAARMQAFRCTSPDQYLDLLACPTSGAEDEWRHLFVLLTNQESYFFRDQGQLQAIRDHVLHELIEHNRHTRTLRIWSAGCSTGEEAYSLAMMLDELLPLSEDWRVLILGTDLSEKRWSERGTVFMARGHSAPLIKLSKNDFSSQKATNGKLSLICAAM